MTKFLSPTALGHTIRTSETVRRGYPPQDAAHIGLRTLRRFLEKHLDEIERIVFVVDDLEIGMYEQILPLYFPRCENEEIYACYKLPHDVGGPNGEPLLPERQIRVVDQPIKYSRHTSELHHSPYGAESYDGDDDLDRSIDLVSGLESSVIVGKTSFAKMKNDVDKKWLMENGLHKEQPIRNPNRFSNQTSFHPTSVTEDEQRYELNRRMLYNSLLRQARLADHSDLIKLRWMYVNGTDRLGRSVVVIIGKHFRSGLVSLERALLYFLYQMDRIKDREYTVCYFHSGVDENNMIPLNFLRYVYDTVDDAYVRNLNAIYIVHPTFWFKLASWWFTTFSATGLKNKVVSVKSLLDIDTVLELQHLKIPQFILNVDFAKNGTRYVADDANEFFY